MLADIVKAVVTSQADFELVGEVVCVSGLADAVGDAAADILIVGAPLGRNPSLRVLYGAPQLKIVEIDADGRRGTLHELRPNHTQLDEISPAALVATIRTVTGFGYREERP